MTRSKCKFSENELGGGDPRQAGGIPNNWAAGTPLTSLLALKIIELGPFEGQVLPWTTI